MHMGQAKKVPFILRVFRFYFSVIGQIFPKFVSNLGNKLWRTPPKRRIKPNDLEFMQSANHEFVDHELGRYTSYKFGSGSKKALIVHAWGGHTADFKEIIPELIAADYQVTAFDFPAHGLSGGKTSDLDDVSKILLDVDQKHGPFDLVITHSGGIIATFVSYNRGLRTPKKMISISPLCRLNVFFKTHFIDLLKIPPKVERYMEDYYAKRFQAEDLWNAYSVNTYTEKFNIPSLIIHDEHDTGVPVSEAHFLNENWKNSSLKVTQKLGHWRLLRDQQVVDLVKDYIGNETPNVENFPQDKVEGDPVVPDKKAV